MKISDFCNRLHNITSGSTRNYSLKKMENEYNSMVGHTYQNVQTNRTVGNHSGYRQHHDYGLHHHGVGLDHHGNGLHQHGNGLHQHGHGLHHHAQVVHVCRVALSLFTDFTDVLNTPNIFLSLNRLLSLTNSLFHQSKSYIL